MAKCLYMYWQVHRGVPAFSVMYGAVGLGWLGRFMMWSPVRPFMDKSYAIFAKNRLKWTGRGEECTSGRCEKKPHWLLSTGNRKYVDKLSDCDKGLDKYNMVHLFQRLVYHEPCWQSFSAVFLLLHWHVAYKLWVNEALGYPKYKSQHNKWIC